MDSSVTFLLMSLTVDNVRYNVPTPLCLRIGGVNSHVMLEDFGKRTRSLCLLALPYSPCISVQGTLLFP